MRKIGEGERHRRYRQRVDNIFSFYRTSTNLSRPIDEVEADEKFRERNFFMRLIERIGKWKFGEGREKLVEESHIGTSVGEEKESDIGDIGKGSIFSYRKSNPFPTGWRAAEDHDCHDEMIHEYFLIEIFVTR